MKTIGIMKNGERVATCELVKPENGHSRLELDGVHVKLDVDNVKSEVVTLCDENENIVPFRNVGDDSKPKFQAQIGNVTISVTKRFTTWSEGEAKNVITF